MARKHAIVMGASMAGLMAARALSDHFEAVTLIEQDGLPEGSEQRRGVPQGRHTHGLLAGGREEIERCFPGCTQELIEGGAIGGDVAGRSRWFFEGGCLAQFESGLQAVAMTRPFFEGHVRRRLLQLPNVRSRVECRVEGLAWSGSRVVGVSAGGGTMAADLVVDATGRGSKAPQWLEQAGYAAPVEERVEVALAYTTRFFRRHPDDMGGDFAAVIPPEAVGKRGGVMLAQEGDRWTVTLIGHFGQAAPEELDGFIAYAKTLPAPYIHEVVSRAEPIGDARSARMPHSLRRRYELLGRFPEGFLVTGDAICSFNPIYGQGMSVAALEGKALAESLAEGDADLAERFFERAAKVVENPWTIAVGNDLRMPETGGPRNAGVKLVNWYMAKLHRRAHQDRDLALAFHKVANLLEVPPTLMQPERVWRVLTGGGAQSKQDKAVVATEA